MRSLWAVRGLRQAWHQAFVNSGAASSEGCPALCQSATLLPTRFAQVWAAQPQLAEDDPEPEPSQRDPTAEPGHQYDRAADTPTRSLDFNNPERAFAAKSTFQLARSLAVLQACQFRPLVQHADQLLGLSNKMLGQTITNFVVRKTFFNHFCAGEDQSSVQPTLQWLHSNGVGGILDYAAEDDTKPEKPEKKDNSASSASSDQVVARRFDYETEARCDQHMEAFKRSIAAAAEAPGQGFAAIKVTALGNPKLLERVSGALIALQNLFAQFDKDMNNKITKEEFSQVYQDLFVDQDPARTEHIFERLADPSGSIDIVGWSQGIRLQDLPEIVKHCKSPGPLFLSALTEEEMELLHNMMDRLDHIAEYAVENKVRLMVDAEHSYFQPAIDHAATELMRKYNADEPHILNTYQCYLKDSRARLSVDKERAHREGFKFGAKLVRGAYMFMENERAKQKGYPSPVWPSKQDTHDNYDRIVEDLMPAVQDEGAEVMIASHNQVSIEKAVALVQRHGMNPTASGVFFGQLLGMADHLTLVLGGNGYRAYKYVPFGPIQDVIPYLVRRAQENSSVLGGVANEKAMIRAELWRRIRPTRALSSPRTSVLQPGQTSGAAAAAAQ